MTERDPASTNGSAADAASAEPPAVSGAPEEPIAVAPVSSPGLRSRQGRRVAPVAVRPVRAPVSNLRQKLESTAALRDSLDAKEAEAQDLRASIEQLRQELTVERTAPAGLSGGGSGADVATGTDDVARAERGRQRPWWVLMLGAVVVALVVLVVASRWGGSPDQTSARPGSSSQASALPAAGPKASPMAWPGGAPVLAPPNLPTSGPGLDSPGAFVDFALDDDARSFDVYEQLKRESATSDPLYLSLPSLPRTPQPAVADLQVTLDGVVVPAVAIPDGGWIVTPPEGTSYTTAVMRFKLTSATIVSRPGRGDSVVLALSGGSAPSVTFFTSDQRVILMSCQLTSSSDDLDPSCQQVNGSERRATIDPTLLPVVSLSVNLPK